MRKQSNKYLSFPILAVMIIGLIFTSCSDVVGPNNESSVLSEDYNSEQNFTLSTLSTTISSGSCIDESTATLKASRKSVDAGTLTYSMDGLNITVTYSANTGWGISETHVWVGNDLENMPAAGNGAPKNGRFPYSNHHDPAVTEFKYTIPLEDVGIAPGDDVYIVAHAVVGEFKGGSLRKTETAYAGDGKGDGPRWWWYIHETTEEFCDLVSDGIE